MDRLRWGGVDKKMMSKTGRNGQGIEQKESLMSGLHEEEGNCETNQ